MLSTLELILHDKILQSWLDKCGRLRMHRPISFQVFLLFSHQQIAAVLIIAADALRRRNSDSQMKRKKVRTCIEIHTFPFLRIFSCRGKFVLGFLFVWFSFFFSYPV